MIRISPTKVRLVGDVIKKKNVNEAMGMLLFIAAKKLLFILKKLLDKRLSRNARSRRSMWT